MGFFLLKLLSKYPKHPRNCIATHQKPIRAHLCCNATTNKTPSHYSSGYYISKHYSRFNFFLHRIQQNICVWCKKSYTVELIKQHNSIEREWVSCLSCDRLRLEERRNTTSSRYSDKWKKELWMMCGGVTGRWHGLIERVTDGCTDWWQVLKAGCASHWSI